MIHGQSENRMIRCSIHVGCSRMAACETGHMLSVECSSAMPRYCSAPCLHYAWHSYPRCMLRKKMLMPTATYIVLHNDSHLDSTGDRADRAFLRGLNDSACERKASARLGGMLGKS
jgi:hypothetical protein